MIVSPPFFPTATSASATVRNLVARIPNATETDVTKVTVFDPENKLVAYSGTFNQGVREIISQWGQIYVLSSDGRVCVLVIPFPTSSDFIFTTARMPGGKVHSFKIGQAIPQVTVPPGTQPRFDAEA